MIRNYLKGQIILFKDDDVKNLYRMIYGAVKVYAIADNGEEHILTIRSAPDVFPLSLLIGWRRSQFFYESLVDSQIELSDISEYKQDNILAQTIKLYYEALHRIADLENVANIRALATVRYLNYHGIEKPTHQLIANLPGLTRETVSVKLKENEK